MVLSLSSDETAVEPPPAATTSPQRPVLRIPKVPKTNTYIWNLLKATVPTFRARISKYSSRLLDQETTTLAP